MGDGAVRMNMAKGIGRCLLSENPGRASRRTYYEAAVFARDLLMPAIALFVLDIRDAAEIERTSPYRRRRHQRPKEWRSSAGGENSIPIRWKEKPESFF